MSSLRPTVRVAGPSQTSATILGLLLATVLAVMIHGYHLGADDAAIYVPAIKSVADPALYPFGAEFFMSHAHLSLFPDLVGDSARFTGLPIDIVIFAWHAACIFLLLLATWRLASVCFQSDLARWGSVGLVAALLSVPVAGTALVIMDPYLTARSLSTPATLFSIACWASDRRKQAAAWLLLTALVHVQMAIFSAAFLACLEVERRRTIGSENALTMKILAGIPFLFPLHAATGAARDALFSRTYFFIYQWAWYEWAGIAAPLGLLWWLSSREMKGTTPVFRALARAAIPFGLLFTAAGMVVGLPAWLENYTRLQPLRSLHLVYVILFVLLGGLIQEYALHCSLTRWLVLLLPLASAMWFLQHYSFPSSLHVEWPGYQADNGWNSAFLWIRGNTPKDAVFALDPNYMLSPGEDMHGFRAVAERSVLADFVKDSGAVSLFPQLADDWRSQTEAEKGWSNFKRRDFEKLAEEFPITWILTLAPAPRGLACPYTNKDVVVCRIGVGPGL